MESRAIPGHYEIKNVDGDVVGPYPAIYQGDDGSMYIEVFGGIRLLHEYEYAFGDWLTLTPLMPVTPELVEAWEDVRGTIMTPSESMARLEALFADAKARLASVNKE